MLSEREIASARTRTVTKSNVLAREARYRLSLQAQRMLLYLISKIGKDDEEFKKMEFSATEFCEIAGIEPKGGRDYKEIEATLTELFNAKGWITLPNGMRTPLSWIERPFRDPESGKTWVKLDDVMRPFLLQLRDNFTQYTLGYILKFRSKFSIRMYEALASYQYTDKPFKKIYEVDELRDILDAENYTMYKNLKQRVLTPAIKEISEFSDKTISVRELKTGRKVTDIEFTISAKTGEALEAVQTAAGMPRKRKHRQNPAPTAAAHKPPKSRLPGAEREHLGDDEAKVERMRRLYEHMQRQQN